MSDPLQSHGLPNARLPCPSTNSKSLLKLMSIELVMPSNHLVLCHPLVLLSAVFLSIRVFCNESVPHIIIREMQIKTTMRYHFTPVRIQISSVQFNRSVMSESLWPHESQHARPPCQSPSPGVHSNSCSLSQWCHPAISSSVIPFSSCPQSLPASESFPMSQPSHEVAKVLEFQFQHHSFQRTPRADFL